MRPWAAVAITGFTVFAVLTLLPARDPWRGIDAASLAQLEEHRLKGTALLEGGAPGRAATEFQAIIRARPRLALGHVDLAVAWLADQRHNPEALRAAQKGAALLPSAGWPKVVLAEALYVNNRQVEAFQRLQAAVQVEPDNLQVLYALVEFLDRPGLNAVAGGGVDALRHRTVERLARLAPENLVVQLEYLTSQARRADSAGALRTLKRLQPFYPREDRKYAPRALTHLDRALATGSGDLVLAAYVLRNVAKSNARYRSDRQALFGSYGFHRLLMPGWDTPPPPFPPPVLAPAAITWQDVTARAGLGSVTVRGTAPIAAGDLALARAGSIHLASDAYQAELQLLLGGAPPRVVDPAHPTGRAMLETGGSPLLFDIDGNQTLDAYVAAPDGDRLWRNTRTLAWGSQRTTISGPTRSAMLAPVGRTRGRGTGTALAVDLDGDGAPDIIRTSEEPRQPPVRYLHNERNFVFRDETRRSGLPRRSGGARQAVFADLDANGAPDLFVVRSGAGPSLFLNDRVSSQRPRGGSDASFRDASRAWGLRPVRGAQAAVVGDFDRDGDFDVAVAGTSPHGTVLYRNTGKRFVPDAAALVGAGEATWIDLLDYDNDTWLDLVVAGPGGVRLLRNQQGQFGAAEQLSRDAVRWVKALDWDVDGDMDLLITDAAGRVRLLDNVGGSARPWMKVELWGNVDSYAPGTPFRLQTVWDDQLLLATGPVTHIGLGLASQAIALRPGGAGAQYAMSVSPPARVTSRHSLYHGW